MKTIPVLITLLALILLSCSKEEETVLPLTEFPAPVVRVNAPEAARAGETVTITVFFSVHNGCGEFGSFDASKSGNTITVRVYPHYNEGPCFQAFVTREVTYTFKPEKAGIYTLQFWAGEDQYLMKTIQVQ